ncbi:hypothetical protein V5G99_03095 [Bibersteinia trehalosi]|uniref:hypothetical protein n=1 Tax=Bibersteinia trehalosi TaxID=47735 RepID=UPI003D26D6C0
MKKTLFFLFIILSILGFFIGNDYLDYKNDFKKIDEIVSNTFEKSGDIEDQIKGYAVADILLKSKIEKNKNRFIPNLWHSWYLNRRISLFAASEYPNHYSELLSLYEKLYQYNKNVNAFIMSCFLKEYLGKKDSICYEKALPLIKAQANYETSPFYWLAYESVEPNKFDQIKKLVNEIDENRENFILNFIQ